jgi:uncharacterized Fe-S cluster protein YjdI
MNYLAGPWIKPDAAHSEARVTPVLRSVPTIHLNVYFFP